MKTRYTFIDVIRGITLLSMIAYHGTWDLVFLKGMPWQWFSGTGAYVWQQSICWTFIFLSGFCVCLGKKNLKRGLMVFGGGLVITAVTLIAMPNERIVFGVLTLIGSCMLLMVPLKNIAMMMPPKVGMFISLLLFSVFRDINRGYLGFERFHLYKLPVSLYNMGYPMTYVGFTHRGFFSTDYFSLMPWFFLFLAGFYLFLILARSNTLQKIHEKYEAMPKSVQLVLKPLAFLGKHSLLIYMLHQPILYLFTVIL